MPADGPGARVTKDLRGVRDTAPYGWRGEDTTLSEHVKKTISTLFRHEPTDREVSDLTAYLESLQPPERPAPDATTAPSVDRGRKLFEAKAGCVRCHIGETREDGKLLDVGTDGGFKTPSLRGVSQRSAFLHDGRATTLENIFSQHNEANRHGAASTLTGPEMQDLIAFLNTL
jgi:cytochrome c peroxidase